MTSFQRMLQSLNCKNLEPEKLPTLYTSWRSFVGALDGRKGIVYAMLLIDYAELAQLLEIAQYNALVRKAREKLKLQQHADRRAGVMQPASSYMHDGLLSYTWAFEYIFIARQDISSGATVRKLLS